MVSADYEAGAIVVVVGPTVWRLTPHEASTLADGAEGRLIGASARGLEGNTRLGVSTHLQTGGSVTLLVTLDEIAVLVESIHRALGELERAESDGDIFDAAGGMLTLDEVCS